MSELLTEKWIKDLQLWERSDMMKIYALAFAVLTLWNVGASAEVIGFLRCGPYQFILEIDGDPKLPSNWKLTAPFGGPVGEWPITFSADGTTMQIGDWRCLPVDRICPDTLC
jgi:hypothetical protein